MEKQISNFRNLLDKLGIRANYSNGIFKCPCPVHDGDNPTAFSMYNNTGVWTCWTHNCQSKWGPSPYGLIAAMLNKHGIKTTVDSFLKDNQIFLSDINYTEGIKSIKYNNVIMSRDEYLKKIKVPCKYYLNRGFEKSTLLKYDVGTCLDKTKKLYGSAIIPVYNTSYTGITAYSARKNTSDKQYRWKHMSGGWRSNSLYNSWFAKSHIKTSGVAILCEGPAKVWRLEEAGFNNAMAIFGTKFSPGQQQILSTCGAEHVVILFDNDNAGKIASGDIAEKLKGLYNITIPKVSFIDLDNTDPKTIQKELKKQI